MLKLESRESASRILDNVIALGHSNFDVAPLLDRRCKASIEEVKAAFDGELFFAQSEKLKIIRKHMENLENLKEMLESLRTCLQKKHSSSYYARVLQHSHMAKYNSQKYCRNHQAPSFFEDRFLQLHSKRVLINAILYINKTGCQWRQLP